MGRADVEDDRAGDEDDAWSDKLRLPMSAQALPDFHHGLLGVRGA